jgi:energy-coupling factor transporter ATP-binding protein EcfA2
VSSALSRSSPDPVAAALETAAARVISAVTQVAASNPVVLIDGRSGAGKSSLARMLVAHWPLAGRVQLIALDSLYPGWDGLEAGVETAREQILVPHARGLIGVWQRWDWQLDQPAEAHAVDPSLPLIVEGAGLLTPSTARLGDIRLWLESPVVSRRHRALTRDGDTYRPHWERWARQEQRHVEEDEPMRFATHVIRVP